MSLSSWWPFEAIVALRFLREGKVQTLFIVVGIAIGVAVIVFMSALLNGLQFNIIKRVLTGQSHIQLMPHQETVRVLRPSVQTEVQAVITQAPLQRLKSFDQWQQVQRMVQQMPEVLVVSPAANGSALAVRGDASRSVSMVGVHPELYFQIVPLADKLVMGQARIEADTILVGTELAFDLGVSVGDKLRLTAATGAFNTLTVAGIFDLGNKGANARSVFVSLRTAQSLLGLVGGVSLLDITLKDVYAAEEMAQQLRTFTGLQADSWIKTNEQFFTAVNAQSTANTAIRFFVALSVGFGIASVLVVSVVQRSREIGILRAMGISRGQILRVFLLQGGLLGLGGALVGSGLGAMALALWQHGQRNPDGSVMFPLSMDSRLLTQAVVLAMLTGLMAAWAPALRAARLDPVVAIRG